MNSADRTTEVTSKPERRYELDWLRVLAVLLLIYFHTAAIFYRGNLGEFYVKNDVASPAMQLFITFVHQWHMPLFFLVSGSSTWFALSFRTGSEYITERFKRLFIPFLFGTLVIVPPQVYYRLLSNPDYQASYLQFYPQFFNGIRPKGNFEWAHLWFLIYLLVFSLIALPLFLHFKKKESQPLIQKIANFLEKPGAIFLLAIPLAIIEGALRPRWPGLQNLYDDWANFCLYLLYFIYGYFVCSDSRFKQAIDKNLKVSVILSVAGMTVLLYLWMTNTVPERGYSLEYVVYQIFRGFNSWCWVIALLGLTQRYLNFNNTLLQYASVACYPFYILHQTVLVAIGFYVVRWNVGIMEKYWVISTASLLGTIILYDLFVKRINILRFLLGLKPINKEYVPQQKS
ncbi:acyltransferase family protein [Microcoleus sp. FACHB-672]|uniref:acyltransferase family protein n=1 Tax=Microcoleus sp. FACHB-672 TaxID=2692825 RepID=UPI001683D5C8|nr:acyltransferase [Microcoleus sp. FACHB-672]MBD2039734.1 acyltransferase family protein [Microcoleus sp. FACHB-672]